MSRKQFPILQFIITSFCVLLPVLCISVIVSQMTIKQLKTEKEENLRQRVTFICNDFEERYQNYKDNTLKIGTISELTPYFMLRDEAGRMQGLKLIQMLSNYDYSVDELLLYYGAGRLYTASGKYTEKFFEQKLMCDEDSSKRAQGVLTSQDIEKLFLWTESQNGYLMLHFPCNSAEGMSVNFLISFSTLIEELQTLLDSTPIFVELILGEEEKLCLYSDGQSGFSFIGEEVTEVTEPVTIENIWLCEEGLLRVIYSGSEVYESVSYSQRVNYFLIISGIMLSALLAYGFGRQRRERLQHLEKIITVRNPWSDTSDLGELEGIHQLLKKTARDRETKLGEYNSLLKQKTTAMIFNGILRDKEEIDRSLYQCNIRLCKEYYFVGAIYYEGKENIRIQLENIFVGDLFCKTQCGKGEIIVFLLELPGNDRGKSSRMKLMKHLIHALRVEKTERIDISISQVYHHIQDANVAYMEAISTMESIPDKERGGCILFWENLPQNTQTMVEFNMEEMNQFSESLTKRDSRMAEECLHHLCRKLDCLGISYENRCYLRQCIIQTMAICMKESGKEECNQLIQELMWVRPSDESNFKEKIMHIIHRYLMEQQDEGKFIRVLQYVQEHYADCELTAEQVAQQAGYTKFYLAKLFKVNTGYSYIDYVTKLRMERACELLRTTDLTISEIVGEVGYVDDSSFRRRFKKFYGTSVTEYRKENKE